MRGTNTSHNPYQGIEYAMKYYYDDPLDVLWMARRFDMKFCTRNFEVIDAWILPCLIIEGGIEKQRVEKFKKFYIHPGYYQPPIEHPSSLHLLEPRDGDKSGNYTFRGDTWEQHTSYGWLLVNKDELKTDTRDDMPFIWPKVEE
jgi:hypothetical protein